MEAMNKKVPLSLVVALILVAMTLTFSVTMVEAQRLFDRNMSSVQQKSVMYDKLAQMDRIARDHYYQEIDDKILYDAIADGYVRGLPDMNNRYYTDAQYQYLQAKKEGRSISIGVEVLKDQASGYMRVVKVYDGSPAMEMGIKKGDYISKIGDAPVTGYSAEKVRSTLQGEEGSTITITVISNDGTTTTDQEITIQRRNFSIPAVESEMVHDIAYMHIYDFNSRTYTEFYAQYQQHVAEGAKALILDVRNNSSTDYDSVCDVLNLLLPSGTLMSGEYKDGEIKTLYTSDDVATSLPMVVLVNENTAFGAELFAMDLQGYEKAKVVGVKTAGQGTLQEIYPQQDGSAIQLTIAKVIPGPGSDKARLYDKIGIVPDFEAALTDDQKQHFYDLTVADDGQIQQAIKIAESLIRGNTPEVPADSSSAAVENQTADSASESSTEGDSSSESESESDSDSSSDSDSESDSDS